MQYVCVVGGKFRGPKGLVLDINDATLYSEEHICRDPSINGPTFLPVQVERKVTLLDLYEIPAGATLSEICQKHRVFMVDVLKLNPKIVDPNFIRAGDLLVLPGRSY